MCLSSAVLPEWIGKTMKELCIRTKYHINIIAIKNGEQLNPLPSGKYCFEETKSNKEICIVVSGEDFLQI